MNEEVFYTVDLPNTRLIALSSCNVVSVGEWSQAHFFLVVIVHMEKVVYCSAYDDDDVQLL